jgi:DMSO/TMAO reductase YedYZ molybdopterin-dependent catalytic subunit
VVTEADGEDEHDPERHGTPEVAFWGGVWRGALAGVLTAAVAIGVGELMAWLIRPAASPVIVVGNRIVDFTPEKVRLWAIRNFGSNDKHVLLTGIYVVLALGAIVIGILAWRWLWVGVVGIAAAGGFAIYCAHSSRGAHSGDIVPAIVATIAAEITLLFLLARPVPSSFVARPSAATRTVDRRVFLTRASWVGLGAVGLGILGRALQHARFNVSGARANVVLPSATDSATAPSAPLTAAPSASTPATTVDFGVSGDPWQTPNKQFYRVDTALTLPQIKPADWKLRIHGMVDREVVLTYDQLKARPLIERWITLNCVSYNVGDPTLVGNAKWLGTRLADILIEAGIHPDAEQLFCTSSDGMTIGVPSATVMDGRDAMLVIGMNDVPLPIEHGFPVRMIVPGLYGYISACKWVVDMEVTTFAKKAYWMQTGWAQTTDIKLTSRIDTPHTGKKVKVGTQVPIAGVAWDQHVGISAVQVRINQGSWLDAQLAAVPSADTWRQWLYYWTPPSAGGYAITARAFDAMGNPQIAQFVPSFPSGGAGQHTVHVTAV